MRHNELLSLLWLKERGIKMAKDDVVLGVEMEKLEIESVKVVNTNIKEENPFKTSLSIESRDCSTFNRVAFKRMDFCIWKIQKKKSCVNIYKKKHKNLIKEPVLKILKCHTSSCSKREENVCKSTGEETCLFRTMFNNDSSLCTLVNNCNQLKISNGAIKTSMKTQKFSDTETLWWKSSCNNKNENKSTSTSQNQGSCSQEALNPPCDVTIDELASYFETLVHIPKKMSTMAEMMYI